MRFEDELAESSVEATTSAKAFVLVFELVPGAAERRGRRRRRPCECESM